MYGSNDQAQLWADDTFLCSMWLAWNLWCNSNDDQGNCRDTPPLPYDIVEFTFVIGDTRAHMRLEGFHRKDLYANVNMITDVKGEVFNKKIICYKRILAKLYFKSDAFFDEVSLIVTLYRGFTCCFDFLLLLFRWYCECLPNKLLTLGNPITDPALLPIFYAK